MSTEPRACSVESLMTWSWPSTLSPWRDDETTRQTQSGDKCARARGSSDQTGAPFVFADVRVDVSRAPSDKAIRTTEVSLATSRAAVHIDQPRRYAPCTAAQRVGGLARIVLVLVMVVILVRQRPFHSGKEHSQQRQGYDHEKGQQGDGHTKVDRSNDANMAVSSSIFQEGRLIRESGERKITDDETDDGAHGMQYGWHGAPRGLRLPIRCEIVMRWRFVGYDVSSCSTVNGFCRRAQLSISRVSSADSAS
jgi:hypothetical protein